MEDSDLAIGFRDLDLIESCMGSFHYLELFRHPRLGLILVLDGELQHVCAWQALYHEPLVHVSGAFVPELKNVLVLGGGSLFAAAELLKYPTIRRCTLVDHDAFVLSVMAKHYPHAQQVLHDRRFRYVEGDAMAFLSSSQDTYDLIVNDCFDLIAMHNDTGEPMFSYLTQRLTSTGVCADLVYRHLLNAEYVTQTRTVLSQLSEPAISLVTVPEYPGVLHLLTMWGNSPLNQNTRKPRNEIQRQWCTGGDVPRLEFYNPRFLAFHLYLPPFLVNLWDRTTEGKCA
jgi:spermidine synthase